MSLKHAILVLLDARPGSGYDLKDRFQAGIGHFWNASHQQIYLELKKLHEEALLSFEIEAQADRPDKKVYQLTEAGRQTLQQWYAEPVKPPRINDALLVKIYGAHPADREALLAELQRHIELHRERLAGYRALETHFFEQDSNTQQQHRLPYLTLRRGIRYEQDCLAWLEETCELLLNDQLPAGPVPA